MRKHMGVVKLCWNEFHSKANEKNVIKSGELGQIILETKVKNIGELWNYVGMNFCKVLNISPHPKFGWVFWKCTWSPFRVIRSSILKRHLVVIQVKAFQFSVPLWPLWKQINLVEYFERALGHHSGESLSIFRSFVACVEINKLGWVF